MDEREKLKALIKAIERTIPYVTATLPYPSRHVEHSGVKTDHPDWVAVHRGRAARSLNQLNGLLKMAQEMKGEEP